jgi:CDP-glucose 4,6-dehydratase
MGFRGVAAAAVGVTSARPDPAFWAGRRVLVTGHTGFKGAWLTLLLDHLGARVTGLGLPATPGGAFTEMRPPVDHRVADLRDADAVAAAVRAARAEIVFHLGAQALVGEGHARPLETFAINVMGTAHVLEAVRQTPAAVVLFVSSDKVYRPTSTGMAFDEDSPLGSTDPVSGSKVVAEHVVTAWRERLRETGCRVGTARAGNVLGGGDTGAGRLAPDAIRAHRSGEKLVLRHPEAIRPWQYVLDVLGGYLLYAQHLFRGDTPSALNFGPDANAAISVAALVRQLQRTLGGAAGWTVEPPPFAVNPTLRLDASRAARVLGWRTTISVERALTWTADWYAAAWQGEDMHRVGRRQISVWWAP